MGTAGALPLFYPITVGKVNTDTMFLECLVHACPGSVSKMRHKLCEFTDAQRQLAAESRSGKRGGEGGCEEADTVIECRSTTGHCPVPPYWRHALLSLGHSGTGTL